MPPDIASASFRDAPTGLDKGQSDEISEMDIMTASAYLEGYRFYGAENVYAGTAYRKGTRDTPDNGYSNKGLRFKIPSGRRLRCPATAKVFSHNLLPLFSKSAT